MVVGVAEVERLAHEVVGQPDELHAVSRGVREPAREVRTLGHEQREVVETGEAVGRFRSRLLDEHEQVLPARAERRTSRFALTNDEPDVALVVVDRPVEVGDGQLNRTEPGVVRDRRGSHLGIERFHAISMPQDRPLVGVPCHVEGNDRDERPEKPPGQFMEEAHEADTKRFVEQARELARRRAQERPPWDEDERS